MEKYLIARKFVAFLETTLLLFNIWFGLLTFSMEKGWGLEGHPPSFHVSKTGA